MIIASLIRRKGCILIPVSDVALSRPIKYYYVS